MKWIFQRFFSPAISVTAPTLILGLALFTMLRE